MSVGLNQSENKNPPADEPTTDPAASANPSDPSTPDGSSESREPEQPETDEFNAEEFEQFYGLPEGTLAGAEDAEAAAAKLQEFTDSILVQGLNWTPGAGVQQTAEQQPETSAEKPAAKSKEGETPANPELDALRAELAEVKYALQQQSQQSQQAVMQQLKSRAATEIDSWASEKFGTSKSRNYKQNKALRELEQDFEVQLAGYQAMGRPVPPVEMVLRQLRAHHEGAAAQPKKPQQPLGTPGSRKPEKGGQEPQNIHQALMVNW